jgi:hypothetical protein
MTDDDLIAACRQLERDREMMRVLAEKTKLAEGDLIAELTERKVDFFIYAPRRRASLETPESTTVDEKRFVTACRQVEIDEDEIAACISRRVSVMAARKLIGDLVPFASVCDVTPGKPRLRLVPIED